MRIAIIGQQASGASVLEAFLKRGDEIAGVFCAPEKAGAKPDPLRLAAEKEAFEAERQLHAQMLQFARSASPAPLADVVLVARAKRARAHAAATPNTTLHATATDATVTVSKMACRV